MEKKKSPVHLIFAVVELSLAVATLIPMASASKASFLGYKALCSFSPISTLILLGLAGLHIFLHQKAGAKSN